MTEQMRAVVLEESISGYHIDGQPYDFEEGQTVVLPRGVARRLINNGNGHYVGDVFEVDDDEYRDAIGVRNIDDPELDPRELTVDELKDAVKDVDDEEAIDRALEIEKANDDRVSAIEILEDA